MAQIDDERRQPNDRARMVKPTKTPRDLAHPLAVSRSKCRNVLPKYDARIGAYGHGYPPRKQPGKLSGGKVGSDVRDKGCDDQRQHQVAPCRQRT